MKDGFLGDFRLEQSFFGIVIEYMLLLMIYVSLQKVHGKRNLKVSLF